jgi:putative transposase
MCLTRSVLPKEAWLKRIGVEFDWPMQGIPDVTYTDNGADFRSAALATGCEEWLIRKPEFRPKGSPQFGGMIERLIGTVMQQMRLLPGSTAKEWKDRGVTANPNETAEMTIDELERDIAIFVTGQYHKQRHSRTKQQPDLAWERGIYGTENKAGRGRPRVPSNPRKFFLDFLERETRTIQKYGIRWDHVDYRNDQFQKYVDYGDGRSFYVCRNPYDVSRIYWKENTLALLCATYLTLQRR